VSLEVKLVVNLEAKLVERPVEKVSDQLKIPNQKEMRQE